MVVGTVAVAIFNLVHFEALIPSTLWLALAAFGVWAALDDGPPGHLLINTLGGFSYRQFVEAARSDKGNLSINFGYELFGRSFYQLRIPAEDVWWVNWTAGQASHRAGRDMDDWHVAIWYRDENDKIDGRNLRLIGYESSRERIRKFGNQCVEFLKRAGIELVWDEAESEWVTPHSPKRKPPPEPEP